MAALLIKNVPDDIHKKLKAQAKEHRRSMAQEALTLVENGLTSLRHGELPPAIKAKVFITNKMIEAAKREGRA